MEVMIRWSIPKGSIRAAELVPHARLIMIDDCGHWVQIEEHNRFLAEVQPWLQQLLRQD